MMTLLRPDPTLLSVSGVLIERSPVYAFPVDNICLCFSQRFSHDGVDCCWWGSGLQVILDFFLTVLDGFAMPVVLALDVVVAIFNEKAALLTSFSTRQFGFLKMV